ncbi:MAG: hypothetical protein KGL40_06695 [Rhodocyclaceae bacterium]|nr:hypothetical protein [Rhodocyclaceae bacterium]
MSAVLFQFCCNAARVAVQQRRGFPPIQTRSGFDSKPLFPLRCFFPTIRRPDGNAGPPYGFLAATVYIGHPPEILLTPGLLARRESVFHVAPDEYL